MHQSTMPTILIDRHRALGIAGEVVTVLAGFLGVNVTRFNSSPISQLAPLDEVTGRNELVLVGRVGFPTVHQPQAARTKRPTNVRG